jgi:hypothetical protein
MNFLLRLGLSLNNPARESPFVSTKQEMGEDILSCCHLIKALIWSVLSDMKPFNVCKYQMIYIEQSKLSSKLFGLSYRSDT